MDDEVRDVVDSNQPAGASALSFVPGHVAGGVQLGAGGFVDVAHSANLALQQFTLEAWVRPDGPGPTNDSLGSAIVGKYVTGTQASASLLWRATDNRFVFLFGDISTERIVSANTFPPGAFYHVAARCSGTAFALFVNGVNQGQLNLVKTIPYSSVHPWTIGANPPAFRGIGAPRTWNGILDEVAIYNRSLTVTEILTNHLAGPAGMCRPGPTGPCLPPPAGQVSWWPFDGVTGDAKDGNDSASVDEVSFVNGKVLDGVKLGATGFIEIPHAANLANQTFTVDAWVRADGAGPNNDQFGSVILAKEQSPPAGFNDVPIFLTWSASTNRFVFAFGDIFTQRIVSAQAFPPGQFHHVAGTYDGSAFRLWVDGILQGQFNLVRTIVYDPAVPWTIGANALPYRNGGFPRTWNGVLDEVEVYNRALVSSELQAIFDAYSSGECKTFDVVAPVVTITSPADGAVIDATSVTLTATVVDDTETNVLSTPAGIEATLPDGGGVASGTVALLEGDNTLAVSAEDEGHNVGGSSISVIRDTLFPAVLVLAPADGAIVGDTPVSVRVRVADANAVTLEFGANVVSFPAGFGTTTGDVDLVEGPNAIPVVVTDVAGHQTTFVLHLTLDSSSPLVTIDSPADGACFGRGDSPIVVTATVDDVTGTVVQSVPAGVSGTLPAGGGVITGSVDLVEGANPILVGAIDSVGLTSSSSITVILDTIPPDVSIDSPADGADLRGTVDYHASALDVAPGSGVARVDLLVDGGLFVSFSAAPFETTLDTVALADGLHALEARAYDGKGNFASSSIQVRVDNTAPVVAIQDPPPEIYVSGTIDFVVSASDAGSGLASIQMLSGGAPPTVDASIDYTLPITISSDTRLGAEDTTIHLDGPLTLFARAVDQAGNESTTEVTVIVDNTAPSKTLLSPTDGSTVSGVIAILVESEDLYLDTIEIWVDGELIGSSPTSPFDVTFDTRTRLDGAMTVRVVSRDRAGNESECIAVVTVSNVSFRLDPQTLDLKSKGGTTSVTAYLEGTGLGLLLPTEANAIELRVPGGNPVPSTAGFAGDNFTSDTDLDGIPELVIKFDRASLIRSIQAGIAGGAIQPNSAIQLTLVAGGGSVIGNDVLRINH